MQRHGNAGDSSIGLSASLRPPLPAFSEVVASPLLSRHLLRLTTTWLRFAIFTPGLRMTLPMHLPSKFFSLLAATVLLSLNSPGLLIAATLEAVASDSAAPTSQNSETQADQLSQKGLEQLNRGQLLEAVQSFEQALGIYRELRASSTQDGDTNAKETELKLLIALGDTYNSVGRYGQALESAQASLALAQELQNSQAKAAAFTTLAGAYQSLASTPSDYQKATRAAISGLTTAWKIKDHDSEAKALAILGNAYNALHQERAAIVFAQQGLKVAKENNIPPVAASSLLTLASVHLEAGDYEQVIATSEQGIDYLQQLQEREAEAGALVMLGLAYFAQGNSQGSLDVGEQALAISQEVKSPLIEALALIVLSFGYSDAGNFQKAIDLINQSRGIAREQNNPNLEAIALEVLGGIYRSSRQNEKAIAAYREAISIHESYSALAGLAHIYQDSNLSGTAITYYKQAINKNEQQTRRWISGLPVWLQASFPQAVQTINAGSTADIYRSLANLLLLKRRANEAQQVLELLKGQELREYTGENLSNGQPAMLSLTPVEAEILRENGSLISFGYRLEECQKTHCPELEQLLAQRAILTQQYYQTLEQLEGEIRESRAADEAFLDPNQLAQKAREVVETQPNTVLIYPLVLEDKIWLLWASKGGIIKSVEVPDVNQAQLEVTVLKFRQLLQNRLSDPDEMKMTGKQLYDWLLKPLESELKANNIENLVFSLDRSTRYVPMSALFDGENYLIENYSVATVLSAKLTDTASNPSTPRVANFRRVNTIGANSNPEMVATLPGSTVADVAPGSQANQEPSILALGVSDAMAGFRSLPNVPAELDAIVRQELTGSQGIYPGQKFLNDSFDFFALRDNLSTHKMLHIATHSQFVPGRANRSYLLLGTGERLAIPDIQTWLDLQDTDLVVLSACQTALGGPGLSGKEIAGIGYYFLKGGANTVMASLWQVDDQSTRLLMEEFYKKLAQGTLESPVTKAQALRQAQLALLKSKDTTVVEQPDDDQLASAKKSRFDHPYYWSPFILMGSGL